MSQEPTWRTSAGGPARSGKKYGWKPAEQKGPAGTWKRPAIMFGLVAGGLAVVGGIVWLIFLLINPTRPGLVAIAADPRVAADRLDVPYDPYGWVSAKRLLEWAEGANGADPKKAPKVLAGEPAWLDEPSGDDTWVWVDKVRQNSKIDPVVIYVGLHGGVSAAGEPVLYTGRVDDKGVPVAVRLLDVLAKLDADAGLKAKRKVLVLDTGRGPPEPLLGEVHHDFVRAVRANAAVQDQIAKTERLVVVCGADDGQRAWESADLGMTPLAYYLMEGLAGDAAPADMSSFTAADLYEHVRRKVVEWAKNNRPTAQEPVLFPEKKGDEHRAAADYDKRRFIQVAGGPKPADLARGAAAEPAPKVRSYWDQAAKLAQSSPAPATYTPLAWRRYRELLLRYEQAAAAGDADGEQKLAGVLDLLAARIRDGQQLDLKATGWTLTLPAAASRPGPDTLARDLDQFTDPANPESLRGAVSRLRPALTGLQQRPVEAHLLVMTDFFHSTLLKPVEDPPADLWKRAVRARLLAEQAAVGVRRGAAGHAYSEQVWPLVRAEVTHLDADRREGEDALFAGAGGASNAHQAARERLEKAEKGYAAARDAVKSFQDGLRVRDELYADLPFLSRWLAEADASTSFPVREVHDRACRLWVKGHQLSARLEDVAAKAAPPAEKDRQELAALVTEVEDGLRTVKADFKTQVDAANPVAGQTQLQSLASLLLVPAPVVGGDGQVIFSPEKRAEVATFVRRIEQELHRGMNPMADQPKQAPADRIKRRAEVALKVFGEPAWDAKVREEQAQHAVIPIVVGDLLADRVGLDQTTKAADKIGSHWRLLAQAADPPGFKPDDRPDVRARVERFGRLAVAVADPSNSPEPATVNRRVRWRDLLEGQAERIARDHWYDENKGKWFAGASAALLADAKPLPGAESAAAGTARALMAVDPLKLRAEVVGGQPVGDPGREVVRWTTEPSRDVRLDLTGGGAGLAGKAVVWAGANAPGWLSIPDAGRKLVGLPQPGATPGKGAEEHPPVRVVAGDNITKSLVPDTKDAEVGAAGFFRGQQLGDRVRLAINARPDLVVSDGKPDPGAMIALRADDTFEPGAISIVLDFSGSMVGTLAQQRHPKNVDWQTDRESRMWQAVNTLQTVLQRLPRNTKVSIRIFSGVKNRQNPTGQAQPYTTKIFPFNDGSQAYADRAKEVDDELRSYFPWHDTPLVDAIKEALADDKALPDTDAPQTLLVLTDGANTRLGNDAEQNVHNEGWIAKVQAAVQGVKRGLRPNLAVHMVFFSAGAEEDAARKMFKDLEQNEGRQAVSKLWGAADAARLRAQLEKILRPKPRLLDPFNQEVAQVPRIGLPVNRDADGPGSLWWYGPDRIPTEGVNSPYTLVYSKADQKVQLRAGDRLVARLSGQQGQVNFRREVYYRDVDRQTPGPRVARNDAWHLAVPGYHYERGDNHFLVATAALESNLSPRDGILTQIRPPFLWWELTRRSGPDQADRLSDGTVYVRNVTRDQLPAPAWRVVAADGREARMQSVPNRLRVWAGDRPPLVGDAPVEVPNPAALHQGGERTVRVGDATVAVSIETLPFYPDPAADSGFLRYGTDRQRCLVVRVADKTGRLVQARIPELGADHKEHRYFYIRDARPADGKAEARPKVAGYTAIFGPITEEAFVGQDRLRIELLAVDRMIADPKAALDLPLDAPPEGFAASKLNPIEPVRASDFK